MRVAFRADASLRIGTGHVMRCLTLAKALRECGHECVFVTRDLHGHIGNLIESSGFQLRMLTGHDDGASGESSNSSAVVEYSVWLGVPQTRDAEESAEVLAGEEIDWLVLDHYALDREWVMVFSGLVNPRKILVIDDLANREHHCDLLVDQNLGRLADDYIGLVPGQSRLLIGTRYALLRSEFKNHRNGSLKRRDGTEIKRILISLGGIDKDNVTGTVIESLSSNAELGPNVQLDIVLGSTSPNLETIREQLASLSRCCELNVNVSNMAEHMSRADLAVGAAGTTAWERCALGLPSVVVVMAENQRSGANALKEAVAAYVIDDVESVAAQLPEALNWFMQSGNLERTSSLSSGVCDGEGAQRVVSVMEDMLGARHG